MAKASIRSLPTTSQVLRAIGKNSLPTATISVATRRELAALRLAKRSSSLRGVVTAVRASLKDLLRCGKEPVINGTGLLVPAKGPGAARAVRPVGSRAELRRRAEKLKLAVEAMPMKTYVGVEKSAGPRGLKPSGVPVTLEMLPLNLTLRQFTSRLRKGTPPVIGYVADGRFKMDLRTVDPNQDERLFRAVFKAFGL